MRGNEEIIIVHFDCFSSYNLVLENQTLMRIRYSRSFKESKWNKLFKKNESMHTNLC
jgi:hypothetical protein